MSSDDQILENMIGPSDQTIERERKWGGCAGNLESAQQAAHVAE